MKNGKVDDKKFDYLFFKFGEDAAVITEPDPDDEDNYGAWSDSTLKHQIFDYWPTNRPKSAGQWPSGINDLPWVLMGYADDESEIIEDIRTAIKNYK